MEFDKVKELATLLENSSLTKLRLEENGIVLELEAEPPQQLVSVATPAVAAPTAAAAVPPAPAPAAPASPSPDSDEVPYDMSKLTLVKAPMVGVFYAAPSPGANPGYLSPLHDFKKV